MHEGPNGDTVIFRRPRRLAFSPNSAPKAGQAGKQTISRWHVPRKPNRLTKSNRIQNQIDTTAKQTNKQTNKHQGQQEQPQLSLFLDFSTYPPTHLLTGTQHSTAQQPHTRTISADRSAITNSHTNKVELAQPATPVTPSQAKPIQAGPSRSSNVATS